MPEPFKCPDCGTWWAGTEHRCRTEIRLDWVPPNPGTFTVHCTCPPERFTVPNQNWVGTCPLHDTQTSYTSPWATVGRRA